MRFRASSSTIACSARMIIAAVVLAESDRDGRRRGRLRVALRSDDARLEGRALGGAARRRSRRCPRRAPGWPSRATAYCKGLTTASGVAVQTGIAAADPALLPVGSVVEIDSLGTRNTTASTRSWTPARPCRDAEVDIYMWSCHEALEFGRRPVRPHRAPPRLESPGDDAQLHRSAVQAAERRADRSPPAAGPDRSPAAAEIRPAELARR